jgi:hypothetical protein
MIGNWMRKILSLTGNFVGRLSLRERIEVRASTK